MWKIATKRYRLMRPQIQRPCKQDRIVNTKITLLCGKARLISPIRVIKPRIAYIEAGSKKQYIQLYHMLENISRYCCTFNYT